MEMNNPFGDLNIQKPNDMSDNQKALTWLKENTRFKDDFHIELSQEAAAMFLQSYADQEKKEYLKDVLEYKLNDCLNSALIGKNRLQGVMNSNRISEFVSNHIKQRK